MLIATLVNNIVLTINNCVSIASEYKASDQGTAKTTVSSYIYFNANT